MLLCVLAGMVSFALSAGADPVLYARNAWAPWLMAAALGLVLWRPSAGTVRALATVTLLAVALPACWPTGERTRGFMPHPNDLSLLAVLLPLAAPLTWPVGLVAVMLSQSRNAALGACVALFLLSERRVQAVIVSTAAVIAWALALTHPDTFTRGWERIGHWMVALQMGREAPWLGWGPASFVDQYLTRLDTLRPLPWGLQGEIAFIPWAHNLYLEQFAERGLLGVIVFGALLGLSWARGGRRLRAAMAAFLVMGLVDLTLLKPWVCGAFWGLVALAQLESA